MSKIEKLRSALLAKPKSFRWSDLEKVLLSLGYTKIEGSGSRVKFDNGNPLDLLDLHKPHPGNNFDKPKMIAYIADKIEGMCHG